MKERDLREEGELQQHPEDDDDDEASEDLRGDDHPRHPSGQHLHRFEVAEVGEGTHGHLLAASCSTIEAWVTSPIGRLGGNSEASPWARQPAVTTVSPRWTCLLESRKSRISSSGSPTSALHHALHPLRHDFGRDGAGVVGDQGHLRRAAGHRGDPADQPVAVDHRIVDCDPFAAADVDRHGRVPDGRRAGDHPGGDRPVAAGDDACGRVQRSLRNWAFSAIAAWPATAWRAGLLQLGLKLAVAAARVEGLSRTS